MGRRGTRRSKLLDDLRERRGYSHLKKEALDRTTWRARFGKDFGPVVRQTTKWWWCHYYARFEVVTALWRPSSCVNKGLYLVIIRKKQRASIVKLTICTYANRVHLFDARVKYGIGVYIINYIGTVWKSQKLSRDGTPLLWFCSCRMF